MLGLDRAQHGPNCRMGSREHDAVRAVKRLAVELLTEIRACLSSLAKQVGIVFRRSSQSGSAINKTRR